MGSFEISLQTSSNQIQSFFNNNPGWGVRGAVIRITKAGEGNMNVVLRIQTDKDESIILKQSRSYVNKYPAIAAPVDRIAVEYSFYKTIDEYPVLAGFMPQLIGYDAKHHLLAIEDLGEGSDYTYLYQRSTEWTAELNQQAYHFLSILHKLPAPAQYPDNLELRKLNAVHLFDYPFQNDHGFDLDQIQTGLQKLAQAYRQNENLREHIQGLRDQYLMPGNHLLHGDFYPGGWLHAASGFKVIDPEFSFIGPAEFDIGVFMAHQYMAHQSDETVQFFLKSYRAPEDFSHQLCFQYCGVEILRRLIGLAQLPVDLMLEEKHLLLERAVGMVMGDYHLL